MSFNLRPLCYWSFWAKPIHASTVPNSSGLTSPTSVTSPKATIVSTIYSWQINFFQENLHFLVCEFGWWKQQPAQQIDIFRMLILQYIKVKHHPSPPRPHQFSPTVSIFNICVWTNTLNWFFCAADFLKDRTVEMKLVVKVSSKSPEI